MYFFSLFVFSFLIASCSLYRSPGRKQFEEDLPSKVPATLTLNCNPNLQKVEVNLDSPVVDSEIKTKWNVHEEIDGNISTLFLYKQETGQWCYTEGLELTMAEKIKKKLLPQVDTWP